MADWAPKHSSHTKIEKDVGGKRSLTLQEPWSLGSARDGARSESGGVGMWFCGAHTNHVCLAAILPCCRGSSAGPSRATCAKQRRVLQNLVAADSLVGDFTTQSTTDWPNVHCYSGAPNGCGRLVLHHAKRWGLCSSCMMDKFAGRRSVYTAGMAKADFVLIDSGERHMKSNWWWRRLDTYDRCCETINFGGEWNVESRHRSWSSSISREKVQ